MKRICFLLLPLLFPVLLFGQTNTDFWFAAPEVTSGHGDQPIYLRLTSFSQGAMVTLSEPANTANFPTQNLYIAPNATITINLTTLKEQVECKPANTILNYGLHIQSSVPITAYYEESNVFNAEIFTLKGNNAMGTSFFIPSQNVMDNHVPITPPAYNSFDIVATEDNTVVTVNPKKAIVGHPAGTPFSVSLNKGQVYSAQATGQTGINHLQGSTVTANKPVCITVKDDSDQYPGQVCYDITGDQIVPVTIIGQEYIVVRGFTNSTMNDWAFITATADGTNVSVDGTAASVLNAGETYRFNLLASDLSSYIETSHPVYVYHVTGYSCEAGSALLPPMDCTGSTQVSFTRTTSNSFEMIILTKTGAQGSFTIDGNTTIVTAAMFSTVAGNPAFVYARIAFSAATLPVGTHIISNSQDIFHMGIIQTYNANQDGCAYGYFSDFASLNLGPDQTVCTGTPVILNAGPNRQSYEWFYNGSPYATGVQMITVTNPGLYSVTVNDHGCFLSDQVQISNYPLPVPVIGGMTSFCEGGSAQIGVTTPFSSYLWTTGASTRSITVATGGTYGVIVTDNIGCQGSASVNLTVNPLPDVTMVQPAPTCINAAPYALTGGTPVGGLYSGPGVNSGTGFFNPASGLGPHLITYSYTDLNGCTGTASRTLTVNPLPVVMLAAQPSVCLTAPPFQLTGGTPAGGTYSGPGVNSATGFFTPSSGLGVHSITYSYTDANGCSNTASALLTVIPPPVVQLSAQPPVCVSAPPFQLTGGTPAGGTWSGSGVNAATGFFTPSSGVGPHTITYTYTNASGCVNSASTVLVVNPLPAVQLAAQPSVCISSPPFHLSGGSPLGGSWSGPGVNSSTGFFNPASGSGPHTITYSYTDAYGCSSTASNILFVNPLPVVQLAAQPSTCISAAPFQLTGGMPAGGTYSGTGVNSSTGFFDPASGLGSHLITYSYTDGNGCTNEASAAILVNPLPSVWLTSQDAVCITVPPFPLTGGIPSGGTYSGPGVNSSTGMFDPSSGTGGHTILYTFTNVNGCINSASRVLMVNPLPVVLISAQQSVCSATPPFPLTGGSPAGGIYSGPGVNSASGFFDPSSGNGPHTITYAYTDENGCANTASVVLTVNVQPVVQIPALSPVCLSDPPFQLTGGTPAGGIYSGPGVNSGTSFFDPASGPGAHLITYTYTDGSGCTGSDSKSLVVNSLPNVQLTAFAPACITTAPFVLSGGNPVGGTYSGQGVNSSTGIFSPSVAGPGAQTITYTYVNTAGCINTTSTSIQVNPLPLPVGVISGPGPVCQASQNLVYTLTGADPLATSFNWEIDPPGAGSVSGNGIACVISLNDGYSGNFGIRFQPASNCGNGSFSDHINITVNPIPEVQLQPCNDPITTKVAKPFRLKGGTPVGGVYAIDGTPIPSGIIDPSTLSVTPPDHQISYTYNNVYNCSVTKTQPLKVKAASLFMCKNTLTDLRDQNTYPTFELTAGTVQRCWMASNLNYGSFIHDNVSQTDNCFIEKYCPGDDPAQCAGSGGLYQWDELMTYLGADNASVEGRQGLCPPEWHVATETEWAELVAYYQGPGLAGWSLLDPYLLFGFNGKTSGVLYQNNTRAFMPPDFSATIFWTSTVGPPGTTTIFTHGLNDMNPSVSRYFSTRSNAFPVRCVRD